MNFLSVISIGYILIALILIAIFFRDQRKTKYFLGQHRKLAWTLITFLILSIIVAIYARFIEPWRLVVTTTHVKVRDINNIKIALVTDIQVGNHKKSQWMEKIVKRIDELQPDLVLLGGDMIDNEGTPPGEEKYLAPLGELAKDYPAFYVLGNHDYGVGKESITDDRKQTGNRAPEVMAKMEEIGIPLLKNDLACLPIKNQDLCIFGIDDIWGGHADYTNVKDLDPNVPLILLEHNPDGILYWPENIKKPDLILAGHTHGGQVWLPFFGPVAGAGIDLPKEYYRGLRYYEGTPIYTSVGAGESGGPIRFLATPEVVILNLK